MLHVICVLIWSSRFAVAGEEAWSVVRHGETIPFRSWSGEATGVGAEVLVLVPGYNGDGAAMLDMRWKRFAERNRLVLLAPTFRAEGDENNRGRGYYYPEQGSGPVMEVALREVASRTGADVDKVLFFGFSAGAHYSHRFALWKPERVRAFVACSAGWWSEPTLSLRSVPALIMCGESDVRHDATYGFFRKGHELGCPWLWRSYKDTDHELTASIRDMAEAFLAHHAGGGRDLPEERRSGDIQSYRTVGVRERESIPDEMRIELPSAAVAEVWVRE